MLPKCKTTWIHSVTFNGTPSQLYGVCNACVSRDSHFFYRSRSTSNARWLVPKMVKNGLKSSFVYWRLIWACLVSKSWPCWKMANQRVPTNPEENRVFPWTFEAAASLFGTLRHARGPKTCLHLKAVTKPENKNHNRLRPISGQGRAPACC